MKQTDFKNKGNGPGPGKWSIRISTFAMGSASLWTQVLIIRFGLFSFGGNELVVGLFFGSWLLAVGIGAFCGGLVIRFLKHNAGSFLSASFLFLTATIYCEFFIARALRGLIDLPAGECPQIRQIITGLILITIPVSFFIGFAFPFLAEAGRDKVEGAGEIYALEAAGSLAAAFIGTYIFLSSGRDDLLAFFSIALLISAAYLCLRTRFIRILCAGLFLVWICLGQTDLNYMKTLSDNFRWEGLLKGFNLKKDVESPYGDLAILGGEGQYQLYLNGQFVFDFPSIFSEETEAHVAATEALKLQTIVLMGGRPGLVKEFCKYHPKTIHMVRLDTALQRLLMPFTGKETQKAFSENCLRIHTADPRSFLRSLKKDSCDLVFSALPEPSSVGLNRFYTVQFFREVKRILSPSGVFSFSIDAGVLLQEKTVSYASGFYKSLTLVFPEVCVAAGRPLRFFAAKKPGIITTNGKTLSARYAKRNISTKYFQRFFFEATDSFQPFALSLTLKKLRDAAKKINPEEDSRPTLFIRKLIIFAQKAGAPLSAVLQKLLSLNPWYIMPWAIIPGLFAFFSKRRNSFPIICTINATGLWGMSLVILLLFMFQVSIGGLYNKIGMLTGAFMCGLSLGAFKGRMVKLHHRRIFLLLEASSVIIALSTPAIFWTSSLLGTRYAEFLFYSWAGILGIITGSEFSIANTILNARNSSLKNRRGFFAALTDGADHLGGCGGSLLTGLILLPALGITGAAIFLAILKTGTFLPLWLKVKR